MGASNNDDDAWALHNFDNNMRDPCQEKEAGKFKRWRISRITRVDEALLDWEGEWAMRNNRECTVPTDPFYYAHIVKHSKGVSQMSSRLHG